MNKLALIPVMVSLASVYPNAQAPTHNHSAAATVATATGESASATVQDAQGKVLGVAQLRTAAAGLLMKLELQNVPAGPHAVHIHTVGKCEGPDFASAGGHFNPTARKHGLLTSEGPHAGDLPNLFASADGRVSVEVLVPSVTLAAGSASLFDADGSALMIHATADDYASDPAGNAGGRIACGVVRAGEAKAGG